MSDANTTPQHSEAQPRLPAGGFISTETAQRLVLVLLALWTILSGLALTLFQDASDATIGGGLHGGQGAAAQRLLGVHLLVLAPIYGLIAWDPKRFRLLLWVPYAAQGGVVATTLYDIITGDRSFADAALPLFVAIVFFALLLYATFGGRQPAQLDLERKHDEPPPAGEPAQLPPPPRTEAT
jgi:hypothetical protein